MQIRASDVCHQTVMESMDGCSDDTHNVMHFSASADCPQTAMETMDGCSDQRHRVVMQIIASEDSHLIALKISEESYYKNTQNLDAILCI